MATATIAARRRSVSTATGPLAEALDALFAFDAPQRFVDLTRPQPASTSAGGALPAHDAWFDHAHTAHSRSSAELAQAEHKALALQQQLLEKENRAVGPPTRRGNVDARPAAADAASASSGSQPRAALPSATVSGLPARLRRKSASGTSAESLPSAAAEAGTAVERTRAQIKSTAAPAPAASARKPHSATRETFAAARRSGAAAAAAAKASGQREKAAAAAPPSTRGSARFMAPTASSRMAAAARGAKAKTAPRRATPASAPASAGAAKDDFQDLQELLARHNKKFKATHTYQPPQHSVRDVRAWEKRTQQSYYELSPEARVVANSEIAELVRHAREGSSA